MLHCNNHFESAYDEIKPLMHDSVNAYDREMGFQFGAVMNEDEKTSPYLCDYDTAMKINKGLDNRYYNIVSMDDKNACSVYDSMMQGFNRGLENCHVHVMSPEENKEKTRKLENEMLLRFAGLNTGIEGRSGIGREDNELDLDI